MRFLITNISYPDKFLASINSSSLFLCTITLSRSIYNFIVKSVKSFNILLTIDSIFTTIFFILLSNNLSTVNNFNILSYLFFSSFLLFNFFFIFSSNSISAPKIILFFSKFFISFSI